MAAQHLPLFLFALSQGPCVLFKCFADGIRFILAIFKEGAGNGFVQLRTLHHT